MTCLSDCLVCISSMRKWRALGPAPRAHSSVPKRSSSHNPSPASCDRAEGQLPFPWCSCSLPVPMGTQDQVSWATATELGPDWKRDICFSSRWEIPLILQIRMESPSQNTLAPLRLTFVSRLPQALLALIQSSPFHRVKRHIHHYTVRPRNMGCDGEAVGKNWFILYYYSTCDSVRQMGAVRLSGCNMLQ